MQIPESTRERRLLLGLIASALVTLLVARFVAVPELAGKPRPSWDAFADAVLADLTVGLLAGALIAFALFWLLPRSHAAAEVAIVPSYDRGEVLDRARQNTDEYWFSGATGRYNRAVTLPDMARQARSSNRSKKIIFQLIDPTNEALCRTYAEYRNRVRSGRGQENWTVSTVQTEVLATIVLAYAWAAEEPLLDVTVAVKPSLSMFRLDLGRQVLIMTKEDEREPALRCDGGTFFYNAFRDDLSLVLEQARVLPDVPGSHRDETTEESIRALLGELGFDVDQFGDQLGRIAELVQDPVNPYA